MSFVPPYCLYMSNDFFKKMPFHSFILWRPPETKIPCTTIIPIHFYILPKHLLISLMYSVLDYMERRNVCESLDCDAHYALCWSDHKWRTVLNSLIHQSYEKEGVQVGKSLEILTQGKKLEWEMFSLGKAWLKKEKAGMIPGFDNRDTYCSMWKIQREKFGLIPLSLELSSLNDNMQQNLHDF